MATFTVYTIGDLAMVQGILNGVAMIFDPGQGLLGGSGSLGMGIIIGLGLLISLVLILAKTMMNMHKGGGLDLPVLLVLIIVLYSMTVPKARVQLEDIYTGQVAAVDNVPVGVALPASFISAVTRHLASKIETAFQGVNTAYIPLTDQVFGNPLKMVMGLYNNTSKASPYITANTRQFIIDCASNTVTDSAIKISPNVINTITLNYNAGITTYFSSAYPQGEATSCELAATRLQADVAAYAGGTYKSEGGTATAQTDLVKAASMGAAPKPNGNHVDVGDVNTAVGLAQYMAGTIGAAQDVTTNLAMSRIVSCASSCLGKATSIADYNACNATCSGDALLGNAMDQYAIDASANASMFGKMAIPAMNLLLGLFYALAPIAVAVAAMSASNGPNLLGKYFVFGVWTQSWLPFAALTNAVTQLSIQDGARTVGLLYDGTGSLSFGEAEALYEYVRARAATAGDLLALTPLISMAVLTGSYYGLTQLANRMSNNDKFDEKNVAPTIASSAPVVQGSSLASGTGSAYGFYNDGNGLRQFGATNTGGNFSGVPTVSGQTAVSAARQGSLQAGEQAASEATKTIGRTLEESAKQGNTMQKALEIGSGVKSANQEAWGIADRLVDDVTQGSNLTSKETEALKSVVAADVAMGGSGELTRKFVRQMQQDGKLKGFNAGSGSALKSNVAGRVDSSGGYDESMSESLDQRLSAALQREHSHQTSNTSEGYRRASQTFGAIAEATGIDKNSADFKRAEKAAMTAQRMAQFTEGLQANLGTQGNINALDLSRNLGAIMGDDLAAGSYLRNQAAKAGVSEGDIAMQRQRIQGKGVDADHAAIIAAIGAKAGYDQQSAAVLGEVLAAGSAGIAPVSTSMIPGEEDLNRANSMLHEGRGNAMEVGGMTRGSEQAALNAGAGARKVQPQASGAGNQAWTSSPGMYMGIPSPNMRVGDARSLDTQGQHTEDAGGHQELLRQHQEENRLNMVERNSNFDSKLLDQGVNLAGAAPIAMGTAAAMSAATAAGQALASIADAYGYGRGGAPTSGGQGPANASRASKIAEVAKDLAARAPDIARMGGTALRAGGPMALGTMTVGAANMSDEQWERVFVAYDKGDYTGALAAFTEESTAASVGKVGEAVETWNTGAQASTSWAINGAGGDLTEGSGQLVQQQMNPLRSMGEPVGSAQPVVQAQPQGMPGTDVQGQSPSSAGGVPIPTQGVRGS